MADPRAAALRAAARSAPPAPSATKYRAAWLRSLAEAKRAEEGAPPTVADRRNADRSLKAQLEWLNIERAWEVSDIVGARSTYRTKGRRRSDNVIDARWNVPGETPEQQAARLWDAHDRGVGRLRRMEPTIVSRNPALEGKKAEPVFFEGSDRLVPTTADLKRIVYEAREGERERKKKPNA